MMRKIHQAVSPIPSCANLHCSPPKIRARAPLTPAGEGRTASASSRKAAASVGGLCSRAWDAPERVSTATRGLRPNALKSDARFSVSDGIASHPSRKQTKDCKLMPFPSESTALAALGRPRLVPPPPPLPRGAAWTLVSRVRSLSTVCASALVDAGEMPMIPSC